MEQVYSVVIVGGGASGLISAIELTKGKNAINGESVLVVDQNDRVAKKLLATGNGQANLSNVQISTQNYYSDNRDFIENFFNDGLIDLQKYFLSLGLKLCVDDVGRIYPLSKQASAVVDILRANVEKQKVNVKLNCKITNITYKNQRYILQSENEKFYAKQVILAFGGKAGGQFGTDGLSYNLAENFGHSVTQLFPSLVQVKTETTQIRGLKGLKENAKVSAYDGEKFLKSAEGDLLFTDYGISGSAVFQVSGHLSKAKNPVAKIEFLPNLTEREIENLLKGLRFSSPLYNQNPFVGVINKKVGQVICKSQGSLEPKILAKAIKNFNLNVSGTLGFNNAQVTKGGVNTCEIDPNTMESKLKKGLFIVGEAVDVDGDCGGYNLTFAFLSAIKASKTIKNENIE